MNKACRTLAFVSGKGGVGKTVLAANFALCSSTVQKTVLVDLDFQNQGASGLLADYLKPGCLNAFDMLDGRTLDESTLIRVREELLFIPAFDPGKTDRFGSQSISASFRSANLENFARVLDALGRKGRFDAMI